MKKRFNRRRFLEISAGATAAVGLGSAHVFAATDATTSISINGQGSGHTFMGIGGLSGGGGTSRLLFDYPVTQQSQILDYLFKPNYGANLHILKVEIGGDTNSTNGAEASHMRSATDQNYNRGYEWWLMGQAKARNSNIKLYGLEWGAPGWFTADIDSTHPFWSHDNITYLTNWITNAQSVHGLHIDYLGGWNESGYNKTWYEDLKAALKSSGLTTQLVASDDATWAVATDMLADSTFAAAIDIVGCHYPPSFTSSADALATGKPLWASENGSQPYNTGAGRIALSVNRDYINGSIVANINWSLVAAWYPTFPFAGDGLMLAEQPWSGNYVVAQSIWAMAHYGQFSQPGWQFLTAACGFLQGNAADGSYITLKSTNGTDYSIILETVEATAVQTVTFTLSGGLSTGTVHVWATNLNSTSSSDWFIQQASITPANGTFSLNLQPGFLYSLTTTSGQAKGSATSPAAAGLALPYTQTFDSFATGQLVPYYSDLQGAFETASAGGGRSGITYRQVITRAPIAWHSGSPTAPITVLGDPAWAGYQVSADVLVEQAGFIDLIGNLTSQIRLSGAAQGYHLRINTSGTWTLFSEASTTSNTIVDTTLASGSMTFSLNTWYRLSLILNGSSVIALINGKIVANLANTTYTTGQAAFESSKWINSQIDNVSVISLAAFNSSTARYKIINVNSGLALEIPGSSTATGATIDQGTYTGANNQLWHLLSSGSGAYKIVNINSGLVLDDLNQSTALNATVGQATATGSAEQQWKLLQISGNTYTILNVTSGLVLDVFQKSKSAGVAVNQYSSNAGTNQQWTITTA